MSALRLTGTLARDAEPRIATDGTAFVYLEVHQDKGIIAAAVRRRIGQGPAAQIAARSAAAQLRAGVRVTVHAAGFDIAYSPCPHLLLLGVDHVERQVPLARTEPSEADA
jgi:hypothetical protein